MKNRFKEKKIPDDYHTLDRAGQVTIICLHTGHNRLNSHMNRRVNLVPWPPCTCGTEHIRQICSSYQHLIEQIWSDGTSGAVWEERITREDNWIHSAGWLIRIIEKKTIL